jgi:DNA-binding HxlR family transcriptional regulator
MAVASYQQFCPVAMAAEILCTRWTIVVLREMFAGSTRFNELCRGCRRRCCRGG